jgi:rubrerythrin
VPYFETLDLEPTCSVGIVRAPVLDIKIVLEIDMAFSNVFDKRWRSLRKALYSDSRQKLREILCQEYVEKAQNAVKFREYAAKMIYPQYRDKLLRIAHEEQEHVRWLLEKILALGGEVPQVSFTPRTGKNPWERLLAVLEKKTRHVPDRIERLLNAERIDPDIAQGLRRMRQEEETHRAEIKDMLMRSDPQAGWVPRESAL